MASRMLDFPLPFRPVMELKDSSLWCDGSQWCCAVANGNKPIADALTILR